MNCHVYSPPFHSKTGLTLNLEMLKTCSFGWSFKLHKGHKRIITVAHITYTQYSKVYTCFQKFWPQNIYIYIYLRNTVK